jgi:ABC-type glycerol-3-phosphate transport system substrate-binding protein
LKISRIIYFVGISFLLLTGCTSGKVPTATATAASTSATPVKVLTATATQPAEGINVDESKLKGIQVVFMHPWSGAQADLIDQLVAEFNQTNTWGIMVVVETPGSASALADSLNSDLDTSMAPQIIAAPIETLMALNKEDPVIVDLSPYVSSTKYGFEQKIIDAYAPVFWNQDDVNGYRYGIPAQRTAKVLVYNSSWANELGFTDPPTTPDEFEKQVCAASSAMKKDSDVSNDGLGGWVIDTDAMTMASWVKAFGGSFESNGSLNLASAQMNQSFVYLRKLLDEGCAWISNDPSPYDYFANRQTLVYSADLEDLSFQESYQNISGSKDEWSVIPFPTKGDPFILSYGSSYAIVKSSDEKQLAAWLFIRWMSSLDHEGALVKAGTSLPMGNEFVNYSIELEDTIPQWGQVIPLLAYAQINPQDPQWTQAKMIMEDAAWQLFKTDMKSDQIPALTRQMDATLKELAGE